MCFYLGHPSIVRMEKGDEIYVITPAKEKRFGRAKNCALFDKCYVCSSFISSVKCSRYDFCESDVTSGQ